MKFSGKVGNWPVNKWLNFDGDIHIMTLVSRVLAEVCSVPVVLAITATLTLSSLFSGAAAARSTRIYRLRHC